MCGRVVTQVTGAAIADLFALQACDIPAAVPRWNAAPGQAHLVVLRRSARRVAEVRLWGLRGPAAQGDRGRRLVNARSEAVATRPSFRSAFATGRVLVPIAGFYEWGTLDGSRDPFLFTVDDGGPFAVAAIAEPPSAGGAFCLLTTSANDVVGVIHDRMPVILDPMAFDAWLSPETPPAALRALCVPLPGTRMSQRRVSRRVNDVRHDDADLLRAVDAAQLNLF